MMPVPSAIASATSSSSTLVPASATLPLESATLRVFARGGIARVVLEQTFANHHADPLAVTYVLPLPADAAVSGFAFRVGDRRIEGEIDRKRAARERYDDAIAHGHTAALLEQDRSSLFTQEIGNVPPGARVICEIVIDQPLRWLDEGSWEWRFPLAAAPRYLGEKGRVTDASRIAFDVTTDTMAPRASLTMDIVDVLADGRSPESPSHPLQCAQGGVGKKFRVELGGGNRVELDRDVVVRWPVAELEPSVTACAEHLTGGGAAKGERAGESTYALLTIVPPLSRPTESVATTSSGVVPRDLIVLLDTSGSMGGTPLDQARRVTMALVDGLLEQDTIELIEFSNSARRWSPSALHATKPNKQKAIAWLSALRASGSTEMREGILEALRPLRDNGQRQIVLITDGLIGFEQEIVATILERLPLGSRVHTVGVGSSVNRSLTGPAARAGKGVEVVIGLGEDPERAAQRIRAKTEAPLVVDVTIGGAALVETAPVKIPDLYAGAPVLVSAKLRSEGGEIIVRGRTRAGLWEERARVTADAADAADAFSESVRVNANANTNTSALAALFGREAVEDAEMRLAAGGSKASIDRRVEELGLEYGIATRMTSWIAVDKTPSVDPLMPTRREVVPQMLPHGMSVEGLGLRSVVSASPVMAYPAPPPAPGGMPPSAAAAAAPPPPMAMGRRSPARSQDADDEDEKTYVRAPLREESKKDEAKAKKEMAPSPAPSPSPEPSSAPRRPRPMVRGSFTGAVHIFHPARIVSRNGREITIEITVGGDIDWDPESFDVLLLANRADGRAKVDLSKTTRKTQLSAGQTARIVLVLDQETEAEIVEIVFARVAFAIVR